jgi:molybdenum cofactor cytidylyltransferase
MKRSNSLAIIVLAAGSSSRLEGNLKQLLIYKNESLLKIAVKKALSVCENIFVVLGHDRNACEKELEDLPVNIIYNKKYKQGIGSSLSFGIKHTKDFDFTMIMLCDQPFIPNEHLKTLKENIEDENIITSLYSQSKNSTVPAIFPKKYYKELEQLNANFGAKSLLQKYPCKNIILDKKFSIDIDTKEDVQLYIKEK